MSEIQQSSEINEDKWINSPEKQKTLLKLTLWLEDHLNWYNDITVEENWEDKVYQGAISKVKSWIHWVAKNETDLKGLTNQLVDWLKLIRDFWNDDTHYTWTEQLVDLQDDFKNEDNTLIRSFVNAIYTKGVQVHNQSIIKEENNL